MTLDPEGAEPGAEPPAPTEPPEPEAPDQPAGEESPAMSSVRAVPYRGEDLDAERGPGLGCFRFQLVVLIFFVVLTPIGVTLGWPDWLTAAMLFTIIILLFFTGQTMIFLMRLVAADRRGRRRPVAGTTPTVGQIEDASADAGASTGEDVAANVAEASGPQDDGPTVRQ